MLRRRWVRNNTWSTLPAEVTDTIAVVAFGVAGLWALAMGIDAVTSTAGLGSGQWFSAAPVALVAVGIYGVRLIRNLRQRPVR